MKKYLLILLFIFTFFLFLKSSKADVFNGEIYSAEYVEDIYVKKERGDGYYQYKHAKFLRKSTDNSYVYCLEPFVSVDNAYDYEIYASDYAKILNLTDEEWQRINLLSYYGYNYKDDLHDHTADHWYYITQIAIWRTVDKVADIYFTDRLNGKRVERFTQEFNELESLVQNHFLTPAFNMTKSDLEINQKITLTDYNNVLKYYDITSSPNIRVTKDNNNNNLIIEALDAGDAQINFSKKATLYTHNPLIYFSNYTQKILETGNYYPVNTSFNLNISGAHLKIIKIDSEIGNTLPYAGISFQILNYNNETLCHNNECSFSTNEEGEVNLPFTLAKGEYKIVELKDSNLGNYKWNQEPISFVVDDNTNALITIHFPNTRIKGKLTIYKYGETYNFENNIYEKNKLDNVLFNIYANNDIYVGNNILYHKDDYVTSITTKDGMASVTLELGDYYLKEVTTLDGYKVLKEPIYFTLDKINNEEEFVYKYLAIENYLIKKNLKIYKIDAQNNTFLAKALLALYSEDGRLIYSGYTNEEGFLEILDLPLGNYYIQELKAPDGYILNEEKVYFTITDDLEEVNIYFYNEPNDTTIDVPDTNINIIYNYPFILIEEKKFKPNKKCK